MPWPRETAETGHVAGLGSGLAFPQCWKWGWGQILMEEAFYLMLWGNLSHKKRDYFTLKISSTQD